MRLDTVRSRFDAVMHRLPHAVLEVPELLLFAYLCVLSGIPQLILGAEATPNSLDDSLPGWAVRTWSACLLVGGVALLLGWFGRLKAAYRLRRGGLLLLACASIVYGLAIVGTGELGAMFAAGTYFLFAATMFVRFWVVGQANIWRRS